MSSPIDTTEHVVDLPHEVPPSAHILEHWRRVGFTDGYEFAMKAFFAVWPLDHQWRRRYVEAARYCAALDRWANTQDQKIQSEPPVGPFP